MKSTLDVSSSFTDVARAIASKVAEVLCAPTFVINQQGTIIATSNDGAFSNVDSSHEDAADNRDLYQISYSSDFFREGVVVAQSTNAVTDLKSGSEHLFKNALRIPLRHHTETGEIVIGASSGQEPVPPRLAEALVELVINQTIIQNNTSNQHELKNQLIDDLLHGQIKDEVMVFNRAKRLGIDLAPPRAVILVDAADYILRDSLSSFSVQEENQRRRTQFVISSIVNFFHLPNDTICANLGQGKIAVLKASDTKNLDIWANREASEGLSSSWANLAALKRAADALLLRLRSDTSACINIGIGRYHPGIYGLARSYEDARAALSLGTRFQGDNQVHCLGEMGVAAFVGVSDESTKVDLARYLLSPLDHEAELLITLDVFFAENCCPSSTAKRLSIHRNTLSYRLDKIASLTGLDPRQFDQAVQMRLSLLLRSLQSSKI